MISRIGVYAILQTIALPTELPRRDLHFTGKLESKSNGCTSNGLDHHVEENAIVDAVAPYSANRGVRDSRYRECGLAPWVFVAARVTYIDL